MVECSYVSEGCPRKDIPIELLETHEQFECEYRTVWCNRRGCQLTGPINFRLFEMHQKYECQGYE